MFSKKVKCFNCGRSFSKEYKFCPFCSSPNEKTKKYKSPEDELLSEMKMPFPFNALIKKMVKDMSKQIAESQKSNPEGINTSNQTSFVIDMPGLKKRIVVNMRGPQGEINEPGMQKPIRKIKQEIRDFSKKDSEQFSKLPKKEPKTSVRRLSHTVIYEIEIPKAEKDKIIINHLENSIEIKALTKEKAYFKVIPVSLPIKSWNLDQDILTLELEPV